MHLDAQGGQVVALVPDPIESARAAHLRYVHDDRPGIRRLKKGKGFSYVGADGKPIKDKATIERIAHLRIPPAWTSVWICPLENGHIQAVGRDARGRKQYRYHARWREVRDETKYGKMLDFGAALPQLRKAVERDIAAPRLPKRKVLAAVVELLERTHIRVGNEEYARQNGSFGLTTMREEHVDVRGDKVKFHFRGKSGKEHAVGVRDKKLAQVVRACSHLPGHELFQFVDDEGQRHSIDSADVNDYLRELTGYDFTAKDFRTWAGTTLALKALCALPPCAGKTARKKNLVTVVKEVASLLGNTPAVCRRCYVHPAVLETYLEDALVKAVERPAPAVDGLSDDECRVMAFLREVAGRDPVTAPLPKAKRRPGLAKGKAKPAARTHGGGKKRAA